METTLQVSAIFITVRVFIHKVKQMKNYELLWSLCSVDGCLRVFSALQFVSTDLYLNQWTSDILYLKKI